jgi:anti-sigma B factor antagonist
MTSADEPASAARGIDTSGVESEELSISSDRRDGWLVIIVSGELDLGALATFDATLTELAAREDVGRLCLDLSGLAFMDSSGIRGLLEARSRVEAAGWEFAIGPVSSAVRRVLAMAGLEHILLPPDGHD